MAPNGARTFVSWIWAVLRRWFCGGDMLPQAACGANLSFFPTSRKYKLQTTNSYYVWFEIRVFLIFVDSRGCFSTPQGPEMQSGRWTSGGYTRNQRKSVNSMSKVRKSVFLSQKSRKSGFALFRHPEKSRIFAAGCLQEQSRSFSAHFWSGFTS